MHKVSSKDEERGAYAVLFSILLGSGLLLSLVLLAFDSGNITLQRSKIQNVAQSSALSIARDCALLPNTCAGDSLQSAQTLAVSNALFPETIDRICGYGVGTELVSCTSSLTSTIGTENSTDSNCRNVSSNTPYVRVDTKAILKDKTGTKQSFLESLFSNGKFDIRGCAQATWGKATSTSVYLPFAYSYCDWLASSTISSGAIQGPIFEGDKPNQTCSQPPKTAITGWLGIDLTNTVGISASSQPAEVSCPNPDSSDKPAIISVGDVLQSIPRDQNSKNLCKVQEFNGMGQKDYEVLFAKMSFWLGKKLFLPLITTTGSSQAAINAVVGFTQFELVAYAFKSQRNGDPSINTSSCKNNEFCMWGKFSKSISQGSNISSSINALGTDVQAIKLI
jgi:Flp pilus assembly protein TadG